MKFSYAAAGILALALGLWMASGLLKSETDSVAAENEQQNNKDSLASAPMKVEYMTASLTLKSRNVVLQGQLEPQRHLQLRAETSGTVGMLHVSKGQRITSGEAVLNLNLSGRDTDLREAQARVQSAASEQQAAASLRKQGLQSKVQLQQTQTQLEAARAQLDRIQRDIDHTQITAPFAGVINALPVELGELVERGAVVAELIDDSSFLVTAQAAQQTVAELSVGKPVEVKLITGETLPGKLVFISAMADSQTRSFAIEAQIDNANGALAAGVSASMIVPIEQIEAMFITPSALALGDNGELGVKLIDENDMVEFAPIKIISNSLEGAWVTGIPNNSRVITLGQGFVNHGQSVEGVPETSLN